MWEVIHLLAGILALVSAILQALQIIETTKIASKTSDHFHKTAGYHQPDV